jgi:glutamine synthetase
MTNENADHLVLLGWNDLAGVTRLRGFPWRLRDSGMRTGLGWPAAGHSITPFGGIAPNKWGPTEEVRQIPDPQAHLYLPASHGQPELDLYLTNSFTADGEPWGCCPRSFCLAMLRELREQTGLAIQTAFEHEFTLLGADTAFVPGPVYSLEATRIALPFLQDIVDALNATGADLQTYDAESGVGQYEVSCGPARDIAGADRCVISREAIRETARRRGLRATFTPKPSPTAMGNGAHLHFSLLGSDDAAASYAAGRPGQLSDAGAQFVAGVFEHLAALTALCGPSPISYLRLGPGHWSCGYAAVGVQNREAALRICPPATRNPAEQGRSHNVELRVPDGLCNPYLVIGALAAAGLDGVKRKLPLPPLVTRDPSAMTEEERRSHRVEPLPGSLRDALAALRNDSLLVEKIPAIMLDTFESIKHEELKVTERMSHEEMCEAYIKVY